MSTTTRIEVTEDLMNRIYESQKAHLIATLENNRNGDDGGDYITSALDCFQVIQEATCDQTDFATVDQWLNTPLMPDEGFIPGTRIVQLGHCAGDGICFVLYDLNCPALPTDDDV